MLRFETKFSIGFFHILQFQERDHERVVDLFSTGLKKHIPASFCYLLTLPRTLLVLVGVPLVTVLLYDSWLLAVICIFSMLLFFWFLVSHAWNEYVSKCLHTDMADIPKSYMSARGSCFWVAESGDQVVGIVGCLPVKDPPLGRKQLQLLRLSVSSQHRGQGIGKALVRTVFQFARNQGCRDVVLETGAIQQGAVTLYYSMGFQKTRVFFIDTLMWLLDISEISFTYSFPSAPKHEL